MSGIPGRLAAGKGVCSGLSVQRLMTLCWVLLTPLIFFSTVNINGGLVSCSHLDGLNSILLHIGICCMNGSHGPVGCCWHLLIAVVLIGVIGVVVEAVVVFPFLTS